MDASRFVFLDETGTATDMARRYGRSPCGERLVAAVPQGHWKTTTFIAGLRQSGVVTPLVLDGPMTGPAFRAYGSARARRCFRCAIACLLHRRGARHPGNVGSNVLTWNTRLNIAGRDDIEAAASE